MTITLCMSQTVEVYNSIVQTEGGMLILLSLFEDLLSVS